MFDHSHGVPARPLLSRAELAAAERSGSLQIASRRIGDRSIRLLAQPVRAQDRRLVVVVGQSLEARDTALADLRNVLLIGGPAALVLASVAGYVLIGAALRPVEEMRQRERAFVSDAGHELRTPLASLRTELELVARDRPSGKALATAIDAAIGDADRMGRLADDLLLLSRADDRKLALECRPVAVATLLSSAAERARRGGGRGLTVAVGDVGEVYVLADPERLGQAIDNLVANALRYARARVELAAVADGGCVELHVRDDGPGFAPEFLPQAWERFTRADAARTDGGSGLGLSIVRTIVEAHGGRTVAANAPGGGADVWIELRRIEVDRNRAAPPPREPGATLPECLRSQRRFGRPH